jgi:hypothetical protein
MNKKLLFIVVSVAMLSLVARAQLVDVLDNTSDEIDGQFQSGLVQYTLTGAMVFTTGYNGLGVQSITAMLDYVSPSDQTLDTALYLAPEGVPSGSPVYTSWSAPSISGKLYTFSPNSALDLSPNTEYAFTITGPGTVTWDATYLSNGTTSADGWSMNYFDQGNYAQTVWNPADVNYMAQGYITAVPEPSTWAMLGSGVVTLLGLRRRWNG